MLLKRIVYEKPRQGTYHAGNLLFHKYEIEGFTNKINFIVSFQKTGRSSSYLIKKILRNEGPFSDLKITQKRQVAPSFTEEIIILLAFIYMKEPNVCQKGFINGQFQICLFKLWAKAHLFEKLPLFLINSIDDIVLNALTIENDIVRLQIHEISIEIDIKEIVPFERRFSLFPSAATHARITDEIELKNKKEFEFLNLIEEGKNSHCHINFVRYVPFLKECQNFTSETVTRFFHFILLYLNDPQKKKYPLAMFGGTHAVDFIVRNHIDKICADQNSLLDCCLILCNLMLHSENWSPKCTSQKTKQIEIKEILDVLCSQMMDDYQRMIAENISFFR